MGGASFALDVGIALLAISTAAPVAAKNYSPWTEAASVESLPGSSSSLNTGALEGCPMQSPDGVSLYFASNRPGGLGGLDIWVAHRPNTAVGFGDPMNLGEPINSPANDLCPTPVPGGGLFFVSARGGGCGDADIYFARDNPTHGWTSPVNLGCTVNSPRAEASPSFFEASGRTFLYFSSGPDIYSAERQPDGSWGAVAPVAELNSPGNDLRPNVRKDGLEIVLDSDRTGTLGGQDLYFATRSSVDAPWSTPVNAGTNINTAASELRGSFSRDAETLYFGRTPAPEGSMDLYFTTRDRVSGG